MRRALLFGGGVFFGLVAEALLWVGPRWYTSDERTRIAGLGLIAASLLGLVSALHGQYLVAGISFLTAGALLGFLARRLFQRRLPAG